MSTSPIQKHKRKIIFSAIALSLLVSGCSPTETPTDTPTQTTESITPTKAPTVKPSAPTKESVKESPSKETKPAPKPETKPAPKSTAKPAKGSALKVLSTLKVNDTLSSGYKRALFGSAWIDIDNNNCDTREDTLALHMSNVSKSGNCEVVGGVLVDSYTGETIQFSKDGKGGGVDIDHVVALSAGWKTGMSSASEKNRESFANDPLNLLPVDAGLNRYKSDKDASEWIPSQGKTKDTSSLNATFDCPYVARQIAVKAKYGMWVTSTEKARMNTVLKACPDVNVPKASDITVVVGAKGKTPETGSKFVEKKTTEKKSSTTVKKSAGKSDPDMGSCSKAKASGYGPYSKGSVEYGYYRDGDGDGTVCE